jgi:SAM-dependent methyltransferase
MEEAVRRAMAPTRAEIASLPLSSNSKIVGELLAKAGGSALDIGCGDGTVTRLLATRFSPVTGIDVKAKKIDEAKAAAAEAGVKVDFLVASGDAIPFADRHFDVVAFSNSLHHMPDAAAALREATRVLRPGGRLYIMEPVPSGNYHDATRLVNDETAVRTQAYRDLLGLAGRTLTQDTEIMYRARREFSDFAEWQADQIDRDARRKALFDARPDEVKDAFLSNADLENGRLVFHQVFRVNLLSRAA